MADSLGLQLNTPGPCKAGAMAMYSIAHGANERVGGTWFSVAIVWDVSGFLASGFYYRGNQVG